MEHIGIDLGARHSHLVVLHGDQRKPTHRKVKTSELPQWLSSQPKSHVVMEACTQSPAIARASLAAGHETKVVPAQLVRLLGVGARGIKTDDRDAEALARASKHNPDLPSVHLRSETSRHRRELVSARANLMKARMSLSTSVKSWLRGRLIVLKGRASSKAFSEAVRTAAVAHPDGLPRAIELMLETFDHLTEQVDTLRQEIATLAEGDNVCSRLMEIPGVGPHIAFAFTTHLDCPERFATADDLASYLALAPGEATTGGKVMRTRTIKAGPLYLKSLLVQAAWSMWRTRPNDPAVLWARRLAERRNTKGVAIVALARKLATVMWSMWKNETSYDPARASHMRANVITAAA